MVRFGDGDILYAEFSRSYRNKFEQLLLAVEGRPNAASTCTNRTHNADHLLARTVIQKREQGKVTHKCLFASASADLFMLLRTHYLKEVLLVLSLAMFRYCYTLYILRHTQEGMASVCIFIRSAERNLSLQLYRSKCSLTALTSQFVDEFHLFMPRTSSCRLQHADSSCVLSSLPIESILFGEIEESNFSTVFQNFLFSSLCIISFSHEVF